MNDHVLKLLGILGCVTVLLPLVACASAEQKSLGQSAPRIGPPPSSPTSLSETSSGQEYAESAPGVLTRSVFNNAAELSAVAGGLSIEVRDLLVGPGKQTQSFSLPGGAVLETRSGNGIARVGAEAHNLETGTTLAVAEGSSFSLENADETPLNIRAFIISAR